MTTTADFVVAGAGHNSLITAAYLAKAGYEVLILDYRSEPGGGAATEEVLLPGYGFDTCSTGHTLIQVNPLLAGDELGLISDYGLTYIDPDPVAHVIFPDGEHFTMWLDLDRTLGEISRFSAADAAAYAQMLREFDEVKGVYGQYRFTPIGYGPTTDEMLADHPLGAVWRRRNVMSAWDVIRREFESRHMQAFMSWMAFQTAQPLDSAGSGYLAYSLAGGRQRRSWSIPLGGSASLPRALVGFIEAHGGSIVTDTLVTSLIVEDGRCVGVESSTGEQYRARVGVVSSIHIKTLVDMAEPELWGDDFLYGVDTYDEGISTFASYYATTEAPGFLAGGSETVSAVSAGTAPWPEDVIEFGRGLRERRLHRPGTFLLFATPTIADPSRAPEGGHTVKILSMVPWEAPEEFTDWAEGKEKLAAEHWRTLQECAPNLTDDKLLARKAKSPVDVEQSNPHMWHGTIHGGDRGLAYGGAQRPVPGWASHRMPIPGLYQTGATTHPGGSITGGPGRNAAWVILDDQGRKLDEVVAAGG
ncbi:MAG TPA: NAD(P)/FAD-dependent oxidoreductase [Acidimicrobiia bacterium]|nr:NAD(P)/FAD-dependent oxidoreductase [Acidimicrobiia bacterium]